MRIFVCAILVCAVNARAYAQRPSELDRIQMGVVLSPRTDEAMGTESATLRRAVETALSAKGMGSMLADLPTRFVAYVDLVPLQEEMINGGMTVVKEQLSITFGERSGGRAIGSFVLEARAVGKSKAGALRNLSTSLNLSQKQEWSASLEAANSGIITFFEQQCSSLLREADLKVQQRQFEDAIYLTTTVPREAPKCHEQAMHSAVNAYAAMLKNQCAAPFASAKARWASSKTRESATSVAAVLGTIPADSPCFGDAALLIDDVARVIATFDAEAARERTEELAFKRKAYEDQRALAQEQMRGDLLLRSQSIAAARESDRERAAQAKEQLRGEVAVTTQAIEAARQVGLERARAYSKAGPPKVTQTIVFK